MAAANLISEDHFLCSICLDIFTDPVSTPCGHNFCKECITKHWKTKLDCPMCKEPFSTEPQLKTNCFIAEMVLQFRRQGSNKPEEVLCDFCTGTKEKAVKSCLECMTSYCETHRRVPVLRKRQLIQPEENLEDRICSKHGKPLELFCQTDQTNVCLVCTVLDHKGHEFVPLKEEYEEKKKKLNLSALNAAPPTKDWTEVRVRPPSYEGSVVRVVEKLMLQIFSSPLTAVLH